MSIAEDGRLYSTGEVARMLHVSQSTVQNYIAKGLIVPDYEMPKDRNGKTGRRKFTKKSIDALMSRLLIEKG